MFEVVASLPLLQIALWGCVGALMVGTLLALRSRWANRRPMRRCILLSSAAHLLLIAVAASVRFATLPPGDGVSKPVRVSLVAPLPRADEVQATAPVEPQEVIPLPDQEGTPADTPPAPTDSETPAATTESLPPPPALLEAPTPKVAPPETASTEVPQSTGEAAAGSETIAEPSTEAPPVEPAVPEESTAPVVAETENSTEPVDSAAPPTPPLPQTEPAPPAPTNPPQPMADRVRPDRMVSVIEQGGSRETEQAVAESLEWLAYAQSQDGRWDANRWEAGREMHVADPDSRARALSGTGRDADTGISALALLTFLGAGHSHLEGGYKSQVTAGLNFLIQSQGADGNLAGNATPYARTYCHSMATFALAEAYALTGDQRLEPAVRRGAEYLVRTQHRQSGGWRYRPEQPGDVSQLGWAVMALRSAELGGIEVPESTWHGIERFLAQVSRGTHGGLACYQLQSPVSVSMTAEALYCRQVLGKPPAGEGLDEGMRFIAGDLPGSGQANYYYWYYATLALHKAQGDTSLAGSTWRHWNDQLKETLVATQVQDGSNRGSWSPNSVWGGYGGRVYSTAMAAMCLEVYYRFGSPQEGEIPWVAGRPRPATSSR